MTFLACVLALSGQDRPVLLERQFRPGVTTTYEVRGDLLSERRVYPMAYMLPFEVGVGYTFTTTVKSALPDGFAKVVYKRPSMKVVLGETHDSPPKTTTEKTDWNYEMTVSPINELTDVKSLVNRARQTQDEGQGGGVAIPPALWMLVEEVQRLALFVGGLESALDMSPRLPLEEVKPGDTWQKTVGFQPQKLKGTDKQAVQRLDITYTYDGLVNANGRRVHRVTGRINLDTDAAQWANDAMGAKSDETGLKSFRLKLDATAVYDLEEQTRETLGARAESTGGFSVDIASVPGKVDIEEKLTGKSTLRRVSAK